MTDNATSGYDYSREREHDRSAQAAAQTAEAQVVDVQVVDDLVTVTARDEQGRGGADSVAGLLPAGIPAAEFLRQQGVAVRDSSWEFAHLDRDTGGPVQGWKAVGTATDQWASVRDRIADRGHSRSNDDLAPARAEVAASDRGQQVQPDRGGETERAITRDQLDVGEDAGRTATALRAAAESERMIEQTARAEVAFDREMTTNAYTADDQSWRAEQAHDSERASAAQRRGTDRMNQADAAESRAAGTTAAPQAVRSVTVRASNRWIPTTPPGHEPARGRSQSRGR